MSTKRRDTPPLLMVHVTMHMDFTASNTTYEYNFLTLQIPLSYPVVASELTVNHKWKESYTEPNTF